jgi:hypothetical protein
MSRALYTILVGLAGTAVGALWLSRTRTASAASGRQRGVIIYDNTPTADPDAII